MAKIDYLHVLLKFQIEIPTNGVTVSIFKHRTAFLPTFANRVWRLSLGSPKISPHGFPKCSKCFKSNLSIEKLSNKKVSNIAWVLLYYCVWLIFNSNVMQHVIPMTSYLVTVASDIGNLIPYPHNSTFNKHAQLIFIRLPLICFIN